MPSVAWPLTIVCPNAPQVVWIQLDDVTAPTGVGGSRSLTCKYRDRMCDTCGQCAGLYRNEKKENLLEFVYDGGATGARGSVDCESAHPAETLHTGKKKKRKEKKPICETGGTQLKDNWVRAR